jgi:hypothetical protein
MPISFAAAEGLSGMPVRFVAYVVLGFALSLVTGLPAPAHAGDGPVFVVPGRPGVPVIINGFDASYTIVEGEFGLDRPGHMTPTIISRPLIVASPAYQGGYYPAFGRRPGYGRREVEPSPNRRLPTPAQPFYREWWSQSDQVPATLDPPGAQVELNINPEINPRSRTRRHPK